MGMWLQLRHIQRDFCTLNAVLTKTLRAEKSVLDLSNGVDVVHSCLRFTQTLSPLMSNELFMVTD